MDFFRCAENKDAEIKCVRHKGERILMGRRDETRINIVSVVFVRPILVNFV